jgi:small subunit ribosomal protein S1
MSDQTNSQTDPQQPDQNSDFESLLNQYDAQSPEPGKITDATVIQVDKDGILVDIGIKRDVLIPARDYAKVSESYLSSISSGDRIPVFVIGQAEGNGELQLSLSKGLEAQVWDTAEKQMQEGAFLNLDVLGHNRGGLIVRYETLRGFIPFSLVPELQGVRSPKRAESIKNGLVGKTIPVKVTEVDRERNRLIFSAEAAQKEAVQQRFGELKKGQVLQGKVVKLVNFGAFVDLGGVDGLVHISQLSWKKAKHPSEVVKVGDEFEVKVIEVDPERQRISLSRKALLPGPWQTIADEIKAGDYVEGIVTRLVEFGAFVKLPVGVEGLIHTSQIGYASTQNPQGAIKPGDKVLLKVLEVNAERKRVALSMRQVPLERQIAWAMENVDGGELDEDEETLLEEGTLEEATLEEAPLDEAALEEATSEGAALEGATSEVELPAVEPTQAELAEAFESAQAEDAAEQPAPEDHLGSETEAPTDSEVEQA